MGLTEPLELRHGLTAAALLVGGGVLGYVVYRVIRARYRPDPAISSWGGDPLILRAIRNAVVVGFVVAGAYAALLSLPLRPAIADPIRKAMLSVVILTVTWVLARVVGELVKLYSLRRAGVPLQSSIFVYLAKLLVYVVGGLVLLQTLGISITPILTALGVGGLAVALALQDTLANLFAGFHILASKKVVPGDFIRLDSGEEGYVVDINWRNTSIRQLPNNLVIVPNARLASAIVTNYHRPEQELSVLVQVGVAYDSDLETVERATVEVAREVQRDVPGAIPDFEPFIRYHTFGDSSIDFTVILRAREFAEKYALMHEFVKRLHQRYQHEGIEIPFPIRTVHLRGGSTDGEENAGGEAREAARTRRPV